MFRYPLHQTHLCPLLVLTFIASLGPIAAQDQNLLPNGGFEIDTDGDGIPDGWVGQPFNFTRETRQEVEEVAARLSQMRQGNEIKAVNDWVIWTKKPEEDWMAKFTNEYMLQHIWQNSRFGSVPGEAELGNVTAVISSLRPHAQVASEPIAVKPETGYRLTYWFKMSHGSSTVKFDILDAKTDEILNCLSLGWSWVTKWTLHELPFRTGPEQDSIKLRLWKYHSETGKRRLWYDDFRLVEDDSVVAGEIGGRVNPEPRWPAEVVKRGYAVAVRPCLPDTYPNHQPRLAELNRAVHIQIAPGEYGSKVLFVRALRNLGGPLLIGLEGSPQLKGPHGIFLPGRAHWHDGGESFVQFRVCRPQKLTRNSQQYEMRPTFLMPTGDATERQPQGRFVAVNVAAGGSGTVWLTVHAPSGMPPGEYRGEIQVAAPDEDFVAYSDKLTDNPGTVLPLIVEVRDLELLEPDVTYGMYRDNRPRPFQFPLTVDYPLDLYIDQRQHGMNSLGVGGGRIFAYEDEHGQQHFDFTQFDSAMERMMRAGFHRNFLFFFEGMLMGSPPGPEAALMVLRHCQKKGYPEPLFYVHDEPSFMGRALVEEMERTYGPARRQGLRTVTSGLDWRRQGEAYDVWILHVGGQDWQEILDAAQEQGAELWAYDCSGYINNSFENNRFYAGLWTWACGLKGNWIWEYQNTAFAPTDGTPPASWDSLGFVFSTPSGPAASLSWEGRREGVTDYRYLYTLEKLLESTESARPTSRRAAAREFLVNVRGRIPLHSGRPGTRQKIWHTLAPNIAPEEYDRIREECARHIQALSRRLPR